MVNAADLKGLNQTQQYERIQEGQRTGELTKPEAVDLATELRLPEEMRQSVSNSKVVAVGYGEAGKGGAAGQKRLSKSSPFFLATSGSTTPEPNRLDLPLDVFVAKLSNHNLVLRGSGVGTKLGYNEGALVEAKRRIGFAVDVLTSVASGDLALAWEGDTPTNCDRRLVGAKNPNWGDVPHFLSGRDGLTLVSAQMGAAGKNPEHADYGYTAPTALKDPDKGLGVDPTKPAEGDNINWDNIDWAGNRTFLEGPAAENVDLELLVGAGPSAKNQIEAAFEIGRPVVYVPVKARDQKDGEYGPADSNLLPAKTSRDAVYLLRPGREPTRLDGLQNGVADAVALVKDALPG